MPIGNFTVDSSNITPYSLWEKVLGWGFHYAVGIAYAALIILLYGTEYINSPTWVPALVVGLVISTFAGLAILMPAMGGGFFGRCLPNKVSTYSYVLIAHAVFAIALYGFAAIY